MCLKSEHMNIMNLYANKLAPLIATNNGWTQEEETVFTTYLSADVILMSDLKYSMGRNMQTSFSYQAKFHGYHMSF